MFKSVTVPLLVLALILPTVVAAQRVQFERQVRIPVRPIDANTFEAVVNDGAYGSLMWCAAARFTRHYLKQRGGKLYVKQAVGPSTTFPGRKSVIFTTQPVPDAFKSYSESIRTAGQEFSQAHAYAICRSNEPQFYVRVRVVGS
ncbi:MAG: hypothetical protein ABJF86_16140 [Tateyamaria sp.]|uniref:hypothetical protein n=1 Tax=Tateyamaria sp. TaxID=1929288 RepID=UPI0032899925